ncbi:MAG: efflux RND transporter permease subunit [Dialister invisus]
MKVGKFLCVLWYADRFEPVCAWMFNVYNDIYFQIGLLTIIGLAAKNAILIVEYAKVRTDAGMAPLNAVEASKIRLRPILMTSCFYFGKRSAGPVDRCGREFVRNGDCRVFGVLSATAFQILSYQCCLLLLKSSILGAFVRKNW